MIDFIVPMSYRGNVYTGCDLKNIRGGVLSDTEKASGNMMGMVKFLSGCIDTVYGDETLSQDNIEDFVRHMPYCNVEYLTMKAFLMRPDSDGAIEFITTCPRCKEKYIYEYINEDLDHRIKFDDLDINCYDEEPVISIELIEPIEIKTKKGEVVDTVNTISLRMPDMNACVSAEAMYGSNVVDMQYSIYVNSVTSINGSELNKSFKSTWGMFIFRRMYEGDIRQISDQINYYGVQKRMERTCGNCGKVYTFPLDISGFFV